jgi:hypothetical protein
MMVGSCPLSCSPLPNCFPTVLSILIVNSDNFPPSAFDAVFKAVGLDALSFAPTAATTPNSGWPTLGSMIDSGKRLVTFLDTGADFNSVPYIIDGSLYIFLCRPLCSRISPPEFTNMWETKFDVTDTTFDCSVNRTKGDSSTQLYLINHFLDTIVLGNPAPDPSQANVTNGVSGVGSLGVQVQTCSAMYGRAPNFFLVDVSIPLFPSDMLLIFVLVL